MTQKVYAMKLLNKLTLVSSASISTVFYLHSARTE